MKVEVAGIILRLSMALALSIYTIINEYKKISKMSRTFDSLTPTDQQAIIDDIASLSISEHADDPTVIPCGEMPQTWSQMDFCLYYGRTLMLTSGDFSGINFATHPAWGGPTRPPRPYA